MSDNEELRQSMIISLRAHSVDLKLNVEMVLITWGLRSKARVALEQDTDFPQDRQQASAAGRPWQMLVKAISLGCTACEK